MPLKKIVLICLIFISFKSTSQILTYQELITLKSKLVNSYYHKPQEVLNLIDNLKDMGFVLIENDEIIKTFATNKQFLHQLKFRNLSSTAYVEEIDLYTTAIVTSNRVSQQNFRITFRTDYANQYLSWFKDVKNDRRNGILKRGLYSDSFLHQDESANFLNLILERPSKAGPKKTVGNAVSTNTKAVAPYKYTMDIGWMVLNDQ